MLQTSLWLWLLLLLLLNQVVQGCGAAHDSRAGLQLLV
jgi:hypothetical protein